jgi:hypothetical protein
MTLRGCTEGATQDYGAQLSHAAEPDRPVIQNCGSHFADPTWPIPLSGSHLADPT